jgi:hypothetical protein
MKKWKWGILLLLGLLLAAFIYCNSKEGFQIQTMNMSYPLKELYLYAPNIKGKADYIDPVRDVDTNKYSSAYSLEEANAKCVSMGATLATPAQVKTGAALGATWCVIGWANDGNKYAPIQQLCPNIKNNNNEDVPVINTNGNLVVLPNKNAAKLVKITNSPPAKAYPLCWGVKPPEPSVNVHAFSRTSYNMLNPNLVSSVTSPGFNELYPGTFTADEAHYALEQRNYNIDAAEGDNPARKYLIDNIATAGSTNPDTKIYKTDSGYTEDMEYGSVDACPILATTRTKFAEKFGTLRTTFSDVSGAVISMLGAKNENTKFSAKLQDICSEETPQSSPACMTLATLDFSLLYSTSGSARNLLGPGGDSDFNVVDTSTSRIAALEALNAFKFMREGELCTAYQRIQSVETYIGCPSTSRDTIGSQCAYVNVGSEPVLQMIGLDVNAQEFLKLRLQEISPYFATSNYAQLVSGILNQLSLTLRLPSLNDFNTANQNFKQMEDRISAIQSYFNNSGYQRYT